MENQKYIKEVKFETLSEQIKIQSKRGLIINDEQFVKQLLIKENYYNFFNGYKHIFLKGKIKAETIEDESVEDEYEDNIFIEYIIALNEFDKKIRNIFMHPMLEYERYLKSSCSYYFSEFYPSKYSYFEVKNYNPQKLRQIGDTLENLTEALRRDISKTESPVGHYARKHQHIPIWVLLPRCTFGGVRNFFSIQQDVVQEKIVNSFTKLYRLEYDSDFYIHKQLIYTMNEMMNLYRNVAAHDERFFCLKADIKNGKKNAYYEALSEELGIGKNKISSGQIISMVAFLKLFITKENHSQLTTKIIIEIDKLKEEIPSKYHNKVLEHMGIDPNLKVLKALL